MPQEDLDNFSVGRGCLHALAMCGAVPVLAVVIIETNGISLDRVSGWIAYPALLVLWGLSVWGTTALVERKDERTARSGRSR